MRSSQQQIQFQKYQGLGNDFILIDNRQSDEPKVTKQQAVQICDRRFGIGADGVIFALPSQNGSDYQMRIFNSDGTEPENCGNGIRCLTKFIQGLEKSDKIKYNILTGGGNVVPEVQEDGKVRVDMGKPILAQKSIPTTLQPTQNDLVLKQDINIEGKSWSVTCVSMGNPHAIVYSCDGSDIQVDSIDLYKIGPSFENHSVFPAKTNTEFVEVIDSQTVKMVVWERGAGRTLACGTGACALVVAGILESRLDRSKVVTVHLPGGPLDIEWAQNDHVFMTGAADHVFDGVIDTQSLAK